MNTNPVGPFQPMNQHPFSMAQKRGLGAGNVLRSILSAGDIELPELAPPAGVLRETSIGVTRAFAGIGETTSVEFFLVCRKASREYLFPFQGNPLFDGDFGTLIGPAPVPLHLFESFALRVVGTPGEGCAASIGFIEVRESDPTLTKLPGVDLLGPPTAGQFSDLAPVPEDGESLLENKNYLQNLGGLFLNAWVFNFDSIPHPFFMFFRDVTDPNVNNAVSALTDGVGFTALTTANPNVAVGENLAVLSSLSTFSPRTVLTQKFHLQGLVVAQDVTGSVEFLFSTIPTNRSPVRTDQGGAY